MSSTRYASVLGLGFGDCGKGHFIHALALRHGAHTVVRFSGGAQAGHNVVAEAADGSRVHHTFSQFGSATFVPGVRTLLLDPMVVHPTALLVEAERLQRIGIRDALGRLMIDGRCRVTTPFHQAAGRLRELLRGPAAHGTCGVGVGETVGHGLAHPAQVIRYQDLGAGRQTCLEKLHAIRETLLAGFHAGDAEAEVELQALRDESLAARWLNVAMALARQSPPAAPDALAARLTLPGQVLFEGAQGILLDEWRGFHPHTTWSSVTTAALESAVRPFLADPAIEHRGVLRTYLTRHGAGPFPSRDESLDAILPEPHNPSDGWQGSFRRGQPDAVLLRYALEAVGPLAGLLVSHLDVFDRGLTLKWCDAYQGIERLPVGELGDLAHQAELTALLANARPLYAAEPITTAGDFLQRVGTVTSVPVVLGSFGTSSLTMRSLGPETY